MIVRQLLPLTLVCLALTGCERLPVVVAPRPTPPALSLPANTLVLTGVRHDVSLDKVRREWVFKTDRWLSHDLRATNHGLTVDLAKHPKTLASTWGPAEHTVAITVRRDGAADKPHRLAVTIETSTEKIRGAGTSEGFKEAVRTDHSLESRSGKPLSELVQVEWQGGDLRIPLAKAMCRVRAKTAKGERSWTLRLTGRS